MVILVYVDDLLVTRSNIKSIKETKLELQRIFKMKDLGDLRYFLGIEFAKSDKGILMLQRKYSLELISELRIGATKSVGTVNNS